MRAAGGQREQRVAGADRAAVQHAFALDGANAEARQVVFAVIVHVGHFRGFAADQRGAGLAATGRNAADHGAGDVDIELAAGEVVEEEQRFGPLDQNIVDAHCDEVDADRVVPVECLR